MARSAAPLPIALPLEPARLERLRLALRRKAPSAGQGAHLHRRMGQSLEFRQFRDYQRGDDIRAVDWAASARVGGVDDLIVRTFEAEERRRLIIVIDCRAAMHLPRGAPKLIIAFWIAEALTRIALAEGDDVVIGTLFAPAGEELLAIKRTGQITGLRDLAARIAHVPPQGAGWEAAERPVLARLRQALRPASAVALISDMLFEGDPALTGFCRAAQQSYRSLNIVELDSWPREKALLDAAPFRLGALAGRVASETLAEASPDFFAQTERHLADHRQRLTALLGGPGLVWPGSPLRWGAETGDRERAEPWFRSAFERASVLPGLLSRVGF